MIMYQRRHDRSSDSSSSSSSSIRDCGPSSGDIISALSPFVSSIFFGGMLFGTAQDILKINDFIQGSHSTLELVFIDPLRS